MFGLSTTYVVAFDVAAIILNSMLLYTIFMRRSYPTVAIKQYKLLLFINLISACSDLVSAYTICNADLVPRTVNYAVNMVYLLSHNITGVVFMLYVIAAIRGNLGTKTERAVWITNVSVISLLTLTTPFTHLLFYHDYNNVYCHGPLFPLLYITTAISLFYSAVLILRHSSIMSSFQIGTDLGFILLILGSVIFQAFFPNCLIENFIIATACIMMNVALDNPAAYFYQSTSCYNQSAFDITIEKKLAGNAEFTLVAFTFDDLSVFRKQHTEKDYEMLIFKSIRRCQKIGGSRRTFILQDNTLVIMQEKGDPEKLINTVEASLSRPFPLSDGGEATVVPHFCLLQFPGEAKTVNDVNLVIQDMLTHIYRQTGRHVIWDSTTLLGDLRREDDVVHAIRKAIRNDGIHVLYQPIFNRKTGTFCCAEALVRLRDEELKSFPDEFIPIAERNGLILDIGEIVLDRVCRFLHESRCEEFGIDHISVNLSMLQLLRRSAVERLVEICRKHEVSPSRIFFEITETAADQSYAENVLENILFLKETGFSLSLDDYGSGYSNMTNIVKFPFDQIKVDKSLLWSAFQNNPSMTVLQSTVKLVHYFGKSCVVEGVEDDEMEALLESLEVDLLQGYKYSKPISAISLLAFVKEKNA